MNVKELGGNEGKGPHHQMKIVLDKYKISIHSISKITGLDEEEVLKLAENTTNGFPASSKVPFDYLILMLSIGIEMVDPNDRIKGIVETLSHEFGITTETIGAYAGLTTEKVASFMEDYSSISYDEKYQLAVSVLFLHYLFKPSNNK